MALAVATPVRTPGFLSFADHAGRPMNISYSPRALLIDSVPSVFLSGSVHLPRIHPSLWAKTAAEAVRHKLVSLQERWRTGKSGDMWCMFVCFLRFVSSFLSPMPCSLRTCSRFTCFGTFTSRWKAISTLTGRQTFTGARGGRRWLRAEVCPHFRFCAFSAIGLPWLEVVSGLAGLSMASARRACG